MAVTDIYITSDGRITGCPPPEFLEELKANSEWANRDFVLWRDDGTYTHI